MLTMEQAVQDIVLNNGLFIIPIDVFSCDWAKLDRIFHNVLKRFERFRPVVKKVYLPLSTNGTIIPDALQIKSVAFWSGNMIPSQCTPLQRDEYDFDPTTKSLQAIGCSTYLVSYLASYNYTTTKISEQLYHTFETESDIAISLQAVPDISTIKIQKGGVDFVVSSSTSSTVSFTSSKGTATFTISNLQLQFSLTDTTEEDISIEYTTKYKAAYELTAGDDFFYTWFGAELLKSIGGIKLVTKFDSLPADITADSLLDYGKQLADKALEYQDSKSSWYEFLPT